MLVAPFRHVLEGNEDLRPPIALVHQAGIPTHLDLHIDKQRILYSSVETREGERAVTISPLNLRGSIVMAEYNEIGQKGSRLTSW